MMTPNCALGNYDFNCFHSQLGYFFRKLIEKLKVYRSKNFVAIVNFWLNMLPWHKLYWTKEKYPIWVILHLRLKTCNFRTSRFTMIQLLRICQPVVQWSLVQWFKLQESQILLVNLISVLFPETIYYYSPWHENNPDFTDHCRVLAIENMYCISWNMQIW